ncbi:hypothetical protein WHZ77_06220 [Bradyrhizobium sp. A5]|uniref:hypothetical protein n=1 Tax=Bradyrhizobium sp. A5 TaxID=3133696 RepID=UPI003249905F
MIGITPTADQICNAPIEVRRWIEREVITGLRLAPGASAPSEVHSSRLWHDVVISQQPVDARRDPLMRAVG